MKETGTCSICEGTYTNYGNNPWPFPDGRACHDCNNRFVTPARILHVGNPDILELLTVFARLGRVMTRAVSEVGSLVVVEVDDERRKLQ